MLKATSRRLTPQQSKLIDAFILCDSQQQAAREAGYSESGARNIWRTFAKPQVAGEIRRRLEKMSMSATHVLWALTNLANHDPADFYNPDGSLKLIHEIPPVARKALAGLEILEEFGGQGDQRTQIGWTKKVKFADRVRVLEILARHHKLLTDKQELTGADGEPISVTFNLSPTAK